jgi:predicted regulator of Ras-like GTPase activity (Roadblock/LC7/MglB family)
MSFESILQKIMDGSKGAVGVALMGNDGIPIVHISGEDAESSPLGDDLGTAGAEFARILGDIHKASDSVGGGLVNEVVISLSRFTLMFREVADDVVLVLALGPNGNIGKSRYLMRRYERELRDEL